MGLSYNENVNETDTKKEIILQSNITLDLNGSVIKQIENDKVNYANVSINDVANVIIENGTLIRDKEKHNYKDRNSSHEWGFGIDIRASKNVNLKCLQIEEMTGDGVIITDLINKNSENIIIDNCNIKGCRRQGISIISGENIEINNCEIFNIEGTAPQAAIDLESWNVRQNIDNIKIHNNKIYDLGSKQAIFVLEKAKTVDISNNELYGGIYSNNIREILNIEKNEVYDCKICIELPEDFKARGEFIKRSVIKNNKLNNTSICLKNVNDAVIRNNILKNKGSIIYNTNIAIYRKIFYDNAIKQFHIGVENTDMNYKVFVGQNEYYNIDENIEWISNKQIEISNDENKIEKYIDRVEKGD